MSEDPQDSLASSEALNSGPASHSLRWSHINRRLAGGHVQGQQLGTGSLIVPQEPASSQQPCHGYATTSREDKEPQDKPHGQLSSRNILEGSREQTAKGSRNEPAPNLPRMRQERGKGREMPEMQEGMKWGRENSSLL